MYSPNHQESSKAHAQDSFAETFKKQCLEGSGIDPILYETAIEIIPDYRTMPGNDPEYPIDEALNHTAKRNSSLRHPWGYGAAFLHENGKVWQIKPEFPRPDKKKDKQGNVTEKPIKYETPKGNDPDPFLPSVPPAIQSKIIGTPQESFWDYVIKTPEIPIVITEGGKKGLCLLSNGYVGLALNGCYGWSKGKELSPVLEKIVWEGRRVTLAFDQDSKPETVDKVNKAIAGLGFKLQGSLRKHGLNAEVYVATWNPEAGKGIDDLTVNKGVGCLHQVLRDATPFLDWKYPERKEKKQGNTPLNEGKRSQADELLDIALNHKGLTLWHTTDEEAYADLEEDGIRQTFPLQQKAFKRWLTCKYLAVTNKSPGSDALSQAINTLDAKAFLSEEREVFLRVAEHEGNIYIDLGTPTWEAVKISPDGWEVVKDTPVRFRRLKSQKPLPVPEKGGTLNTFREMFNLEDQGWIMVASWLLYSFRIGAPYPICILHAPQGCGKSTVARALKKLVDPNMADLIGRLGDERNFPIMAFNTHLVAIDNLSYLSPEQSDMLCTVATGGGFRHRKLNTDSEEIVLDFRRPMVLTGIDSPATRGDLLDRAMLIRVGKPEQRKEEDIFWKEFDEAHPKVFGAICDALAIGLKRLPHVKVSSDTRMMDFARFGTALEPALGLQDGDFMRFYLNTKQEAHETAIESSPLAQAIFSFFEVNPEGFGGTASQLLERLEAVVGEAKRKERGWPKTTQRLGMELSRLQPDLSACGIEYTCTRTKNSRFLSLIRKELSLLSLLSPPSLGKGSSGDNKKNLLSPVVTPDVTQAGSGDNRNTDGDNRENLLSPLKPAHSKAGDNGDNSDNKKPYVGGVLHPDPAKSATPATPCNTSDEGCVSPSNPCPERNPALGATPATPLDQDLGFFSDQAHIKTGDRVSFIGSNHYYLEHGDALEVKSVDGGYAMCDHTTRPLIGIELPIADLTPIRN